MNTTENITKGGTLDPPVVPLLDALTPQQDAPSSTTTISLTPAEGAVPAHSPTTPPRKRRRLEPACQECNRLKLKCTQERPCKNCRKRGIVCLPKPKRSTACDRCQTKKIKCDKNRPCNMCLKSNVPCPSDEEPDAIDVSPLPPHANSIQHFETPPNNISPLTFPSYHSNLNEALNLPPPPSS